MSLDWESRRKLTEIFHQLADSGHQVVTITHDMDWVAAEFESVYVMEHGKFGFAGSSTGIVQRLRTCPASGITTTADYGHSGVIG